MQVGQKRSTGTGAFLARNLRWLGPLLLAFILGWIASSQDWHRLITRVESVPDVLLQSVAPAADLPTLAVDMNFPAYSDLLAQREHVARLAVVAPRPEVAARGGLDKLRGHPYPVAGFLHTSFQDGADTKLAPDIACVTAPPRPCQNVDWCSFSATRAGSMALTSRGRSGLGPRRPSGPLC